LSAHTKRKRERVHEKERKEKKKQKRIFSMTIIYEIEKVESKKKGV